MFWLRFVPACRDEALDKKTSGIQGGEFFVVVVKGRK